MKESYQNKSNTKLIFPSCSEDVYMQNLFYFVAYGKPEVIRALLDLFNISDSISNNNNISSNQELFRYLINNKTDRKHSLLIEFFKHISEAITYFKQHNTEPKCVAKFLSKIIQHVIQTKKLYKFSFGKIFYCVNVFNFDLKDLTAEPIERPVTYTISSIKKNGKEYIKIKDFKEKIPTTLFRDGAKYANISDGERYVKFVKRVDEVIQKNTEFCCTFCRIPRRVRKRGRHSCTHCSALFDKVLEVLQDKTAVKRIKDMVSKSPNKKTLKNASIEQIHAIRKKTFDKSYQKQKKELENKGLLRNVNASFSKTELDMYKLLNKAFSKANG